MHAHDSGSARQRDHAARRVEGRGGEYVEGRRNRAAAGPAHPARSLPYLERADDLLELVDLLDKVVGMLAHERHVRHVRHVRVDKEVDLGRGGPRARERRAARP